MSDLSKRLAKMDPKKRALLAARLAKQRQKTTTGSLPTNNTIKPRPDTTGLCVLSSGQQRLYFLEQFESTDGLYNLVLGLSLDGPLNFNALSSSYRHIIERHDILRSRFIEQNETVWQQIDEDFVASIEVEDLSASDIGKEQLIANYVEMTKKPFALQQGKLINARLLRFGTTEHVLLLAMHHIVTDGWSMAVMVNELTQGYQAFCQGKKPNLPALDIQYADFAHWQQQQSEGLDKQREYWSKQLAQLPELINLPIDKKRPKYQSYRGNSLRVAINSSLVSELEALSKAQGCTLFMTLLSVFFILLARYSGDKDIAVGTPVANRDKPQIEPLIGFFVNTLIMRCRYDDQLNFNQMLAQVRATCLSAYEHQQLPFEQLIDVLQCERSLSHSPLFQVMFVLTQDPTSQRPVEGMSVSLLKNLSHQAKFDLTLSMTQNNHDISALFEFCDDLFEIETITNMAEHYVRLLNAVVATPQLPIHQLPWLSSEQFKALTVDFNKNGELSQSNDCVGELLNRQAAVSAQLSALLYQGQRLSYEQLAQQSNRLANYLVSLGVGPDVRVLVCIPRCPYLVIALNAVLKAGGAYVPVDPNYPRQRIDYMIADSQPKVILSLQNDYQRLLDDQDNVICLDRDHQKIEQYDIVPPVSSVNKNCLSHIIYTSGSTGLPKGVCISHGNTVAMLNWAKGAFTEAERAGVLAATSICFDLSVFELFLPLTTGGTVYLVDDVLELPTLAYRTEVTLVNTVPSAMDALLAHSPLPDSVKVVTLAGEALSRQLVNRVYDSSAVEKVYNLYGPSEDTTYSTGALVTKGCDDKPTIGVPIDSTCAYILDDNLCPVARGVIGQLYLGGSGVSRGYHGRGDLTAERYLPDPFSSVSGARLYKSGDRVRLLANGEIDYLGRIDHQVKVRGFRIELGEIESLLDQHPLLEDNVVVIGADADGGNSIIAYVVYQQGQSPEPSQLRAYMQQQLPAHLVPGHFIHLQQMPLTPNGKIDHKALPAVNVQALIEQQYIPAQNPEQQALVDIWQQVLKLDKVGIHDDFFTLGGHSLLATRVMSHIQQTFNVTLGVRQLFETPTIEQLGLKVSEAKANQTKELPRPSINAASSGTLLPLSFAQQRLWFLQQMENTGALYNVPWLMQFNGPLDAACMQRAFAQLIERHHILHTRFYLQDDQPWQIADLNLAPSLELIDLSEGEYVDMVNQYGVDAVIAQMADEQLAIQFDLQQGPLMRAMLVKTSEQQHVMMWFLHHIITDGWSLVVMLHDLAAFYVENTSDHLSGLKPLAFQYGDYALWQRNWLQGEVLEHQLDFWKKELANVPQLLELPLDRSRPVIQTYSGASYRFELDQPLMNGINQLNRQYGSTSFMTLLAVLQLLLSRYSGQNDLVVGTPIANRTSAQLNAQAGYFSNTLALRSKLNHDIPFGSFLTQVKQTCLDAYAHQDVPFEQLVEYLNIDRDLSHSPLFQVMLVVQNTDKIEMGIDQLEVSPIYLAATTTKFDLTLTFTDSPNGMTGALVYNTDLFDESTISAMVGHFQRLLHGVIASPTSHLSQLPWLTLQEQQQLASWNQPKAHFAANGTVTQQFHRMVDEYPSAIGVVDGQSQYSYQSVNRRANRLAMQLIASGVSPEVRVVISCERGIHLLVAMLAVVKAGGVYVPVDPSYPQQRQSYIIKDSQAQILLHEGALDPDLPTDGLTSIELNGFFADVALSELDDTNPDVTISEDNALYIIYTSGSTGQPKGVLISHHCVIRLFAATDSLYQFGSDDVWSWFHSFSFDMSVWEIWGPLLTGGRLVVVPYLVSRSPEQLHQLLIEQQITVFNQTPSGFKALVQYEQMALKNKQLIPRLEHLKWVSFGGEALDMASLKPWFERYGDKQPTLVNMYGITETTVHVTQRKVSQIDVDNNDLSVGRPMDDLLTLVLDANMQPVPVGILGEIYVVGDGLARGYLNRPELTAERFLPCPVAPFAGQRMYRSGDTGRLRHDGGIDYVGRIDHQIKIRGFRIEMGEVEACLMSHPEVIQVMVMADEQQAEARLVAYVVASKSEANSQWLRDYLTQQLPAHMVPAVLIMLEKMPLTANGKVDRKALPRPDAHHMQALAYEPPKSDNEIALAAIWSELLGVEQIGLNDDFFALGGHSLFATQVIYKLKEQLNAQLGLLQLFQNPKLRDCAKAITRITATDADKASIKSMPRISSRPPRRKPPRARQTGQLKQQLADMSDEQVKQLLKQKQERDANE